MNSMNHSVNKRVLKDIVDGQAMRDTEGIYIAPEEDNYYNVHFVMPGSVETPYEGGLYHGMIRLNQNHPHGPPNVYIITPSGRFTPEAYPISPNSRGICTSFTSYHPESWTPMISLKTLMTSLISYMNDDKDHGVGTVQPHPSAAQRKKFAVDSHKHLLSEPIIQTLFPELCVDLSTGAYDPKKIGAGKKSVVTVADKKKPPSKKKSESSSSEEETKPKKKSTPKKKTLVKKSAVKKSSKKKKSESTTESETESDTESDTESEEEPVKKSKSKAKPKVKRTSKPNLKTKKKSKSETETDSSDDSTDRWSDSSESSESSEEVKPKRKSKAKSKAKSKSSSKK